MLGYNIVKHETFLTAGNSKLYIDTWISLENNTNLVARVIQDSTTISKDKELFIHYVSTKILLEHMAKVFAGREVLAESVIDITKEMFKYQSERIGYNNRNESKYRGF